jgi:hypothetical protein
VKCTEYSSPPLSQVKRFTCTPKTLSPPPFQHPAIDFSQPISENFCNFLFDQRSHWLLPSSMNTVMHGLINYFRPSFVNYCPSNLLSCSPHLPFPKSKYIIFIYRQCLAGRGWGGGGLLSCVVDHILQEFNTLYSYLTRFRTYKIVLPPQTKT